MQSNTETYSTSCRILIMGELKGSLWSNLCGFDKYQNETIPYSQDENVNLHISGAGGSGEGGAKLQRLIRHKKGATPFCYGPDVCFILSNTSDPKNLENIAKYKNDVPKVLSDGDESTSDQRIIVVGCNFSNAQNLDFDVKEYCKLNNLLYIEIYQPSDINNLHKEAINLAKRIKHEGSFDCDNIQSPLICQMTTTNSKLMLLLLAIKQDKTCFLHRIPLEVAKMITNTYLECEFANRPVSFQFFISENNRTPLEYTLPKVEKESTCTLF